MGLRMRYFGYCATRSINCAMGNFKAGETFSTVGEPGDIRHNRLYETPHILPNGLISICSYEGEKEAQILARKAYDWWLKHPEKFASP